MPVGIYRVVKELNGCFRCKFWFFWNFRDAMWSFRNFPVPSDVPLQATNTVLHTDSSFSGEYKKQCSIDCNEVYCSSHFIKKHSGYVMMCTSIISWTVWTGYSPIYVWMSHIISNKVLHFDDDDADLIYICIYIYLYIYTYSQNTRKYSQERMTQKKKKDMTLLNGITGRENNKSL